MLLPTTTTIVGRADFWTWKSFVTPTLLEVRSVAQRLLPFNISQLLSGKNPISCLSSSAAVVRVVTACPTEAADQGRKGFRNPPKKRRKTVRPAAQIAYAGEQHACVVQFFGMAEKLFSDEYGEMVTKAKRIQDLQLKKEQFLTTLFEVSKEIVDHEDITTSVTPEGVAAATMRLEEEVNTLNTERNEFLSKRIKDTASKSNGQDGDLISLRLKEYAEIKQQERLHAAEFEKVKARLIEIEELDRHVSAEIGRLQRAKDAGETLADLKATNCPVCDQRFKTEQNGLTCYLCHQPMPTTSPASGDALHRLNFELAQLADENNEVGQLLKKLRDSRQSHYDVIRNLRSKAAQVAELLKRPPSTDGRNSSARLSCCRWSAVFCYRFPAIEPPSV